MLFRPVAEPDAHLTHFYIYSNAQLCVLEVVVLFYYIRPFLPLFFESTFLCYILLSKLFCSFSPPILRYSKFSLSYYLLFLSLSTTFIVLYFHTVTLFTVNTPAQHSAENQLSILDGADGSQLEHVY